MFFRSRAAVRKSGRSSAKGAGAFANTGVMIGSSVQVFTGRAPASGYLLQVEQALAAGDFRGRESELADLAAFCAHDVPADRHGAGYWRWVAPAWAGKSALLAHFVLHPPPHRQGAPLDPLVLTERHRITPTSAGTRGP
ncbi:hypothetical protein [Streptomyces sp. NPDC048282]|uniref:hypothetical protein n=1 Tax=Streptomyces sp. NPDC048282 TaxID=3365528 RepID=UPI003714445D